MGKLHSLKKEIERDPDRWYSMASKHNTIFGRIPCGAMRINGTWRPVVYNTKEQNPYSYALFVRSVLAKLGIRTDKPRSVAGAGRTYNWRPR